YPIVSRPHNGQCIKFYPSATVTTRDAWNMVAVSVVPNGGDYRKAVLFPTARAGGAFTYTGSYVDRGYLSNDTMRNGPGYWLRFIGVQKVGPFGTLVMDQYDTVRTGWKLIGAIG